MLPIDTLVEIEYYWHGGYPFSLSKMLSVDFECARDDRDHPRRRLAPGFPSSDPADLCRLNLTR